MMRARLVAYAWLMLCLLVQSPVFAVGPDERLANPVLEARAREISKELRCLVCQNQSIDDSEADLAKDLRALVRERLRAGDSNEQVMTYIAARYGDFVRMTPPFAGSTLALWLGPLAILLAGGAIVAIALRRAGAAAPIAPLTPEEAARVKNLLDPLDR